MNKHDDNETILKNETAERGFLPSLKCYCEKNRLEHARHPGSWGYYVQNLYLSLHK
jgi:hypothetical protein